MNEIELIRLAGLVIFVIGAVSLWLLRDKQDAS